MEGTEYRRKGKGRLIPEGELPCIWMEAGLVSYKLCNYEYECESCPFDAEMKKSGPLRKLSGPEEQPRRVPHQGSKARARVLPEIIEEFHYHTGHTWAKSELEQEERFARVRVGVDSFAAHILPRVKDAILPHRGYAIYQGHAFCWIVCGSNTLPLVAPISGTVVESNRKLSTRPQLINADPHGEGWFISIEPSDLERELAKLMNGKLAVSWMANERRKFKRLASLLRWPTNPPSAPRSEMEVGITLADGGEWLGESDDVVRLTRYIEFIVQFFL
jgi:glycine cleavage system H protein